MQLEVFWPLGLKRNTEPVSTWHAMPYGDSKRWRAEGHELELMDQMLPVIKNVGKTRFGDDFKAVVLNREMGRLEIVMSKGLKNGGRMKDVDGFHGFIELYGVALAHAETNQRISHIVRESSGFRVGTVDDWPNGHSGRSK